jgi:uncharacterized protein (TIGR02757 family)
MMNTAELRDFLEFKTSQYNNPAFIEADPISIPHLFSHKEDIEIAAFLSAILAWGNRKAILKAAQNLMQTMDMAPYDFVTNASVDDLKGLQRFVYRTFNGEDICFFVQSLQRIYRDNGGLESVMTPREGEGVKEMLIRFRQVFMADSVGVRSGKHIADVSKKASAKRLNMFLRWMVRRDNGGVDFGLWKNIDMSQLYLPLDLHTGNISRQLGLLTRKQNDWQAVEEVTARLREFDANDPVKYDFALFGLGIYNEL